MSVEISLYIVILLGLVIYFIKPNLFMLYCITIEPLVLPIIAWFLKIYNYENLHEIKLRIIGTGIGFLLIVVFFIEFIRHQRKINISNVLVSFAILCTYLFFFYLVHNFDVDLYIIDVRQSMIPILVISLLFMNPKFLPTMKQKNIFIYIYFFILYELVWCVLNLNGIYIYECQYIENTTYRDIDGFTVDLVSGTFQRFSDLADFFSTIYLYVCILFFYEEKMSVKNFVFFSIVIFSIILISGAKVSFILVFFLIVYCCFTNWEKYKFIALSLIIGASVLLFMFLFYDMEALTINIPGLSRIVNQLHSIVHSSDKTEMGTLSLSAYLLDNFFWRNPILGTGLVSYYGSEAYGLSSAFKTDARIAYILTEYGVLGFIAYLYYYYTIFKLLSKRMGHRSSLFLSFFYFFLLTITQPGFFGYIPIYIYIYLSVVFRNEKNKSS